MSVEQPIPQTPNVADSNLVLGALNRSTPGNAEDVSDNANNGTLAGSPAFQRVGILLDGTDDKIDFGNIGNIQEVSGLFKFGSTSEEMFLTDAGAFISAVSGTITYDSPLVATATIVDGVAGTTIVAGKCHHLVMQFETEAAANFELGTDGSNFGNIEVRDLRVWTTARSLSETSAEFKSTIPDANLKLLALQNGSPADFSVHRKTGTAAGGVKYTRRGADFDGTDDTIDYGAVGNIQEVRLWVNLGSTTEQIFFLASGAYVHIVSGTITYVGLTEVATYVDGVATTTVAGIGFERIVLQFTQFNATDFEMATDGTNFGAFEGADLRARDALESDSGVNLDYLQTRVFY